MRDKGQGRKICEIKSDHLVTAFSNFGLPRLSPSTFFLLLLPHPRFLGTSASALPSVGLRDSESWRGSSDGGLEGTGQVQRAGASCLSQICSSLTKL